MNKISCLFSERLSGFISHRKVVKAEESQAVPHTLRDHRCWVSIGCCEAGTWLRDRIVR